MKTVYPSYTVGADSEMPDLPEEKLHELYSAAAVEEMDCEECGERTWLIGAAGHNSTSECHNCGEEYKVVG